MYLSPASCPTPMPATTIANAQHSRPHTGFSTHHDMGRLLAPKSALAAATNSTMLLRRGLTVVAKQDHCLEHLFIDACIIAATFRLVDFD
jgi:hypothetical protein